MMALFALARLLDRVGDRYPVDFGAVASRLCRRLPRVVVLVLPREPSHGRRALRSDHDGIVWAGVALVLACPLVGIAIGLIFWGWPK
jgi:hypothetical protein